MKKCRDCGEQVSKRAAACPKCGAPTKPKTTLVSGCVGCLGLCVIMGGCVIVAGSLVPKIEPPTAEEKAAAEARSAQTKEAAKIAGAQAEADTEARLALWAMQDFVKQRLKSPTSAKFPGGSFSFEDVTRHVVLESDGVYLVSSYVDADNAFGAKIRTNYVGRIQQLSSTRWKLIELELIE